MCQGQAHGFPLALQEGAVGTCSSLLTGQHSLWPSSAMPLGHSDSRQRGAFHTLPNPFPTPPGPSGPVQVTVQVTGGCASLSSLPGLGLSLGPPAGGRGWPRGSADESDMEVSGRGATCGLFPALPLGISGVLVQVLSSLSSSAFIC